MNNRFRYLGVLLIIFLMILSVSCSNKKSEPDPGRYRPDAESSQDGSEIEETETNFQEAFTKDLQISATALHQDIYGTWNISGLLTDIAEYSVGMAEIEIVILSEGDNPVHTEIITEIPLGLSPGESQPFSLKLPISVQNLNNFEINILKLWHFEDKSIQVEIGSTRLFTADSGVVTMVGEFQNNTDQPVAIYSSRAVLFSGDGNVMAVSFCQVCPRYLDPGDSAPFQFLMYGFSPDIMVDHYEVYLTTQETESTERFEISILEPIHSYIDQSGQFHLMGYIQNDGEKILDLDLLGSFYNQSDEIIGASHTSLPMNSLVPGESSPFDLSIFVPTGEITDWSIQVDSARSNSVDSPSHILSVENNTAIPENFQWTISGSVVNDSGETLQVILIVVGLQEIGTGKLIGLVETLKTGEFLPGSGIEYNLIIYPDLEIESTNLEEFIIVRGR